MVNFKAGAVCLLAGFGLNGVSAFAPQKNSVGKKLDLGRDNMILDTNNNKNVNNDYTKMLAGSMNMVAGGAAAEEYYEGACVQAMFDFVTRSDPIRIRMSLLCHLQYFILPPSEKAIIVVCPSVRRQDAVKTYQHDCSTFWFQ